MLGEHEKNLSILLDYINQSCQNLRHLKIFHPDLINEYGPMSWADTLPSRGATLLLRLARE